MKMYGFPATIPADKVSFLLKVLRNAFLPLYQNGRSKGLSHAEALSQMVLNKSPGFPWTYCGYGDKRTVVMTEHEKLRSFFDACEDYDCIKTTSLKDEIRPNEKVDELKTRVFIISPIEHLYVCERVFGEFVNWFHTARPTPSAVGVSPFNGDWDKVMGHFFEFAKAYGDVDGSAFDINCRSMVFELILKFVLDFIDPTLHSKAIWCFEQAIFGYTITQQGYVFRSAGHNPSGWLLTAIVNTLAMYIMLAVVFFDRYGYDDDTYNMWFEYVMAMIFGDDNVYAVDDEISHDFTPLVVLNGLNVYAPYEGSTHFKPPNGVVFLQAYSEKVDGFWIPKFLSEKCWDSLRYIPDGLSTVQRLSKYCSLLKIYWWKTDFREYLQAKCRVYISYYHNVMRGDPEWDSLVLESLKDFSCDYIPSKIPQSRVALNSRLRKHSFLMSNITKFDKQANGETKATTKQIAKMERKEHPEKKFKRLFKTVYGRGLHGSLKSHSSYYRSLIDPFNNAGAKVPNTLQFAPSGTVQCWQRFTMSGVGPQNACAAWVRPTLRASYRQLNFASPNYSWSTYSDHPAYTDVNAIVDSIKPVSMGLAFQFIGNFNNNDGEVLLAFLPGKSATAKFNFGNPSLGTPTDPYTDYLTAPFMRIIPVNQGGAFVTWRPTDYDALDFNPPSVEKWDRPDGSTILDPLGSCMIFANGLANQTLKLRVTVVTNFECIPKSNKTNFFNLTPAVNDPIEMSVIQHQMQKKLVPISTNIKTVEGVVNSSAADGGYTTNHDEGEHFSGRLYETMVPLIDGMEKLSL